MEAQRQASKEQAAARDRRRTGLRGVLGGLVLALWLGPGAHGTARAADALADWRSGIVQARALAENDAPGAYGSAHRLQAALPVGATPADQARMLNLLARIEVYLARTEDAATHAQQAFDLAKAHGDRIGQAESDLNVALNAVNQGKIDAMVAATTRSLTELEGSDRPELIGEAFLRTSMMYRRMGQLEDSVALAMQAMEIARRVNDPMALALAHQGLAISFDQSFRYPEARDHYEQMRKQAVAAHSRLLEAYALLGLGGLAASEGDAASGEKTARVAIDMFRAAGAPFAVNFGLTQLAFNLRAQGRFREVLAILDQVVATYEAYPNRIGLWYGLNARSADQQSLGNPGAAKADAERAYELAKEINFPLYVSESARRLSTLAAAAGDYRRAYALSIEATEMTARAAREKASARMLELAQRYESESKQRQINALTLRNREQQAQLQAQELRQRWLWSVVAGSVAGFAATGYLLVRLRVFQNDLQQQTAILRNVLDSMADGVAVADERGELILVNATAARILGVPHVAGDRMSWTERYGLFLADQATPFPPGDLPLARAIVGESRDNVEMFMRNPVRVDGCWLSVAARPLTNKAGMISGGVAVFSDVTIRKRSEAALRQREEEFRALVEHTPDFVSRFDTQCRRIYANPALARALGVDQDSLLGSRPADLPAMPESQALDYEHRIREVLSSGSDASIALSLRGVRRETVAYQVRLVAERDQQGRVVSVLAIGRDVTEIMVTQRQLATLLESLPDMIARFDRQGRYLYVNPAVTKVFGISAAQFTGKTGGELGLDGQGLLRVALDRAIAEAVPNVVEVSWAGPDGERTFEARHVPEMDSQGHVASVLGILREITDRKRTERLVRDLGFRREAAREDERKSIARELHDELGQILSALRLEVSVLRLRHGQDNPEIARRAGGMLELVDAVIRVQRDLVSSLRPAVLDMGIGTAIEWLVDQLAAHTGIECELRMSEAQLALDADQTIMVFRIVQESLTNVARHAHARHVAVVLERAGDTYSLTIQDDGAGFDPLGARSSKSFGLMGLNERAQMLEGQLDIRSGAGIGTRVAVTFPAGAHVHVRDS